MKVAVKSEDYLDSPAFRELVSEHGKHTVRLYAEDGRGKLVKAKWEESRDGEKNVLSYSAVFSSKDLIAIQYGLTSVGIDTYKAEHYQKDHGRYKGGDTVLSLSADEFKKLVPLVMESQKSRM